MAMAEEYCKKTFSRLVRCRKDRLSATMHDLLRDPDRFLEGDDCHTLQDNFKSKLGRIRVDGTDLVIKYHNYKDWLHRLRRYFRPTRASKNWHYSKLLLDEGIWVPEPVACIETRIGPLRGKSYFIYEYIDGINGEGYFRKYRHDLERAALGMDMIVDLVNRIKGLGLIHGDIRMSNLIFKNDRICLLDLDDIKPMAWFHAPRVKNRDIRGLRKDIGYNIPTDLQEPFLRRLASL